MSSGEREREMIFNALGHEMRRSSVCTVLFHHAVAEQLGLNATDTRCLDLLAEEGRVTAGRLAELTGLTTGAITAVVDRLEGAGLVRRVPNPNDRRSVLLEPIAGRAGEIAPLFAALENAMRAILACYRTDELTLILDVLMHTNATLYAETAKLRQESTVSRRRRHGKIARDNGS